MPNVGSRRIPRSDFYFEERFSNTVTQFNNMTVPPPGPYSSRAWLLDGPICSITGILSWTGERLEFTGFGAAMFTKKGLESLIESFGQAGEGAASILDESPAMVFSAHPKDFGGYKFPWYSFKKGVNLQLFEKKVKFSLIQPQNTKLPVKLVGASLSEYLAKLSIEHLPAEKADSSQWSEIFEYLNQ